ncbi:MAG: hypothetical protein KJ018_14740 [Burkholderiales bacterium]|nr:hypothetical protein [Burkholderiales bacterium]
MTRRAAVLALLTAVAGIMTAEAQVRRTPNARPIPTRHFIALDGIAGIELTYHGERLAFSMDEIWAALKESSC